MWSITKNVPTMALPLMFILGVAAIKEILEDMDKHKADNIQNGRVVDVLDPTTKTWESKKWSTLRCGQLVRVKNREFVPADLVLLVSSDQTNNGVFINTKSLDGETDLKIREVPDSLIQEYEDDGIHSSGITGQITCEPPSKILTKFEGAYEPKRGGAKTPITLSNVLLRGCQIKQTEFAIGVRVFFCILFFVTLLFSIFFFYFFFLLLLLRFFPLFFISSLTDFHSFFFFVRNTLNTPLSAHSIPSHPIPFHSSTPPLSHTHRLLSTLAKKHAFK